jgi:hypothetical protein
MDPFTTTLSLLLISSLAALTQSTSIPQLQERAIIPFRAPPPRPITPVSPGSLGGAIRPGSGILGSGSSGAAGSWSAIAAGGRGTAPESTTPFLANTNGGNRELVEEAVEAAGLVFDLLQNVVSLFGDDGDDDDDDDKNWRASTTGLPQALKPTQVASTSDGATNATANYILSQNNETYTFLSDPRLMSKDVVVELANANTSSPRLSPNQNLFTPSEYRMYLDDPICFYANIESMYLEAFSSSTTGASASTTPTPTQSLQRRQSQADESSSSSTSCFVMGSNAICPDGPGSPEWTSSQSASVSSLWATELPDQLWSAHFATPATTSGGVTATVTSTTSCSGLNGREGAVTQYRELKFRETSGSDGAETTSTNEVTSGAVKTGGKCGFAFGLVGAAVAAVGLLVL